MIIEHLKTPPTFASPPQQHTFKSPPPNMMVYHHTQRPTFENAAHICIAAQHNHHNTTLHTTAHFWIIAPKQHDGISTYPTTNIWKRRPHLHRHPTQPSQHDSGHNGTLLNHRRKTTRWYIHIPNGGYLSALLAIHIVHYPHNPYINKPATVLYPHKTF